jgi:hypothetical protein
MCAILRLSLLDFTFWTAVKADAVFVDLLRGLAIFDSRQKIRGAVSDMIKETVQAEKEAIALIEADPKLAVDMTSASLSEGLWSLLWEWLADVVNAPSECYEYFKTLQLLLVNLSERSQTSLDIHAAAFRISELLVDHTSTEVRMLRRCSVA